MHTRTLFVALLIAFSIAALAETVFVNPSYAQMGVQSHSHTSHTGGQTPITPPPFQSTTSVTVNTGSGNGNGNGNGNPGQGNGQENGRNGGVPPGLVNAWAHSNMSVVARAVTHAIFLNGTHGVELAEIAINASSNGQMIDNVAFNETVAQIDFDQPGAVELDVNSSQKPMMVFADGNQLTELPMNIGLTPNSNAWVYDQNTHALTVFADPSSITIFYDPQSTPVPEFPAGSVTFALAIAVASSLLATVLAVTGKKHKSTRR